MLDTYTDLPGPVRWHIYTKQSTPAWQNNMYRKDGELRPDAFELAFEWGLRETYTTASGKEKTVLHPPAFSLDDLRRDIAKQTPELWKADPYAHYDVKSAIFTLAEMQFYLQQKEH
jgi:hypothetical protein